MILRETTYSNREIARVLDRMPQTIRNEIKRSIVHQVKRRKQNGKTYDYYYDIYDPAYAQDIYETSHSHCRRRLKWSLSDEFVDWADTQMLEHHWSLDAVMGAARQRDAFMDTLILWSTTL